MIQWMKLSEFNTFRATPTSTLLIKYRYKGYLLTKIITHYIMTSQSLLWRKFSWENLVLEFTMILVAS